VHIDTKEEGGEEKWSGNVSRDTKEEGGEEKWSGNGGEEECTCKELG
jgi:hypothetical protein